ncbi:YqeB family protein [Jidongwangia harbinensis]|uniref:YqeB family protein n=1 Tax=Jidongwangia harbinensis TaxID=2878561 RepID=UPI001CD9E2EE|nr:hypothetical protein [Jidongwangia harbinensis]MCA2217735.1 hypothetical protein [Jidongwangia harbinensis]
MLEQTTTVATAWWLRAAVWLGVPAAGAGLCLLLDRLADWAVELPWAPLRGPLRVIGQIPEPQATIGALVLGGVAGTVLALLIDAESLTVRVSGTDVVLHRPGVTRTVPRADVAMAFRDGERLVLLGRTGRELAREPAHLSPKRLRPAFAAHGVAWSDRDPYADAYRRWIPDSPQVPPEAHAVFAARQEAIRTGDDRDTAELRDELARLGFVVRDERKRQYWRRVDG